MRNNGEKSTSSGNFYPPRSKEKKWEGSRDVAVLRQIEKHVKLTRIEQKTSIKKYLLYLIIPFACIVAIYFAHAYYVLYKNSLH